MARAFNSQFTALFVETPDFAEETPENKERLHNHIKLAEQLGANIETIYGDDVPYQIAEYARLSGITKIVLGRSAMTRKRFFGKSYPDRTAPLLRSRRIFTSFRICVAELPYPSEKKKRLSKKTQHFHKHTQEQCHPFRCHSAEHLI